MKNFLEKKRYFKERQLLYETMKKLSNNEVERTYINGLLYEKAAPENATHVFVWFDRKPMVCEYYDWHKSYLVGNQQLHISNPNKKTNRVIEFVKVA